MFYLFTEKGITDRFFCGDILEGEPSDEVKACGYVSTFQHFVSECICTGFATRKEAEKYSRAEEEAMQESNEYAERAMYSAERYGCEGVDCD